MKNTISREEFVRTTIMNTMDSYLRLFCAPHTVDEAHKRCIEDAEKLADRVYGCVEMTESSAGPIVRIVPDPVKKHTPTYQGYRKDSFWNGTHDSHPSMTRRLRGR